MTFKSARLWVSGLAAAASLAALNSPQTSDRHDEPVATVLARVPQKARAKRNPLQGDRDGAEAGQKLFEQHCSECHGESGGGSKRGPALRGEFLDQAAPGEIFWVMTNGVVRHGMPAWSKLPEPQRWQLVAFLQSLKNPEGGR